MLDRYDPGQMEKPWCVRGVDPAGRIVETTLFADTAVDAKRKAEEKGLRHVVVTEPPPGENCPSAIESPMPSKKSPVVLELEALVERRHEALDAVRKHVRTVMAAGQEPTAEDKKNLGDAERSLTTAEKALQTARDQQAKR